LILQKDPNNTEILTKRGYTYSLMEEYEKAIPDYEAALKIKPDDYDTVQRLQYARGMLAAKNAPPVTATPTPTPAGPGLFTPLNIGIAIIVILIIAAVVRAVTRGKPEVTSGRIR
jgi:tetratricopeptide (TPR) repeat protein